MENKIFRSPFFYVGDKYKIVEQIKNFFPKKIRNYYEPFVGGGSSFLNTKITGKYILNDLNDKVIGLHRFLQKESSKDFYILEKILGKIRQTQLSCSYIHKGVEDSLKKEFPKTYYAKHNKTAYALLRQEYNNGDCKDFLVLYILLIYGFNHMIRFNKSKLFNLPVGNVDFNQNVVKALKGYNDFMLENEAYFFSMDYQDFLKKQDIAKEDFIYFDPPYLISSSEYNKNWKEENDKELYECLDKLNHEGKRFGLSNLLFHKSKKNEILEQWMKKYHVYQISSNYISRFDNTKKNSLEVYITNVKE